MLPICCIKSAVCEWPLRQSSYRATLSTAYLSCELQATMLFGVTALASWGNEECGSSRERNWGASAASCVTNHADECCRYHAVVHKACWYPSTKDPRRLSSHRLVLSHCCHCSWSFGRDTYSTRIVQECTVKLPLTSVHHGCHRGNPCPSRAQELYQRSWARQR